MSDAPIFTKQPTVSANPNKNVPLVAFVEFETEQPSTARVDVSDANRQWRADFEDAATAHRLPVYGLRAGTDHQITVSAWLYPGFPR